MLPFLEKRIAEGSVVEITSDSETEGQDADDISDIALGAIADHMIFAFKSGDAKELAKALGSLCELAKA